jgi:hypothetical protein
MGWRKVGGGEGRREGREELELVKIPDERDKSGR